MCLYVVCPLNAIMSVCVACGLPIPGALAMASRLKQLEPFFRKDAAGHAADMLLAAAAYIFLVAKSLNHFVIYKRLFIPLPL